MSPHICIGSGEDARNLERLKEVGVTHVLNCARQLNSAHPKEFVHGRLELEGEKKRRSLLRAACYLRVHAALPSARGLITQTTVFYFQYAYVDDSRLARRPAAAPREGRKR